MPPANTPQITPPRSETPSSARPLTPPPPFLEPALVLDESDVHVEALRSSRAPPRASPPRYSSSTMSGEEGRHQRLLRDMDRLDRMRRRPQPQSGTQNDAAQADAERHQREQGLATSYGDRIPPPTQQSLYDWAPRQDNQNRQEQSQDDDDDDDDQHLDDILEALRNQNPDTHSEILEFLGRRYRQRESEEYVQRSRWRNQQMRSDMSTPDRRNESLRSAAIMQHARASVRWPSGTERMLRYLRNRERNGQRNESDREDAAEDAAQSRSSTSYQPNTASRYESNRLAWQTQQPSFQTSRSRDASAERDRRESDARARVDAYRRGYLADPTTDRALPTSTASRVSLEGAIKYLDALRSCLSYEDVLSAATDAGLTSSQLLDNDNPDFVTSIHHLPVPAVSSLLHPGAVFEGTQNTALPRDSHLNSSSFSQDPATPFDATRSWLTRPWLSHTPITQTAFTGSGPALDSTSRSPQDRWPVKVKIQAVDYERMTVAGIMEAYDVPTASSSITSVLASSSQSRNAHLSPSQQQHHQQLAAPKQPFPITTYLEGQIIDFNTHSFLTPPAASGQTAAAAAEGARYNSNSSSGASSLSRLSTQGISFPPTSALTDAANWRNLPPFNAMKTDEAAARALLSRDTMQEIMTKWIFMRWKERCFIHSKLDPCYQQRQQQQQQQHPSSTTATSPPSSLSPPSNTSNGIILPPPQSQASSSSTLSTSTLAPSSSSSSSSSHQQQMPPPPPPPPPHQQQAPTLPHPFPMGEGDDSDTGHGLTISGFYYVSLRRSDGCIDGLYFDTKTSPYQHLNLSSKSSGLHGAWEFK